MYVMHIYKVKSPFYGSHAKVLQSPLRTSCSYQTQVRDTTELPMTATSLPQLLMPCSEEKVKKACYTRKSS